MNPPGIYNIKTRFQKILGENLYYSLGYSYLLTHRDFRTSIDRMKELKDKHKGQRCFIIGNGPSLRSMDLSPLKYEHTFGLNRIYLMFEKMGFSTSYYVIVNKLVVQQCSEEILTKVTSPKFVSYDARRWINFVPDMMFLYCREGPRFFQDVTRGVWQGATVTYIAMQLAYFLGFQKVFLIGVDHSYKDKGRPNETIVSQGDDRNHFDPGYFGKGFRWQLPDLETSEIAYQLAKKQFEGSGREILDATVSGKLDVFTKVDFKTLFD
jgi:hypothetical protein